MRFYTGTVRTVTVAVEETLCRQRQHDAYYGEEMMRKRIQTIAGVVTAVLLGGLLVACSSGDVNDREARKVSTTPTPAVTSTPTLSPTPTPDPYRYISEKVALTTQGTMTVRETFRYDEEGVLYEALTEQKAVDAADDAWELISRTTCSGTFTVKRVTERYEAGVLQSVQTEVTEEDGMSRTQYAYYTDGVMTQRDTDETDGNGRTLCSWTEFFDGDGKLTYSREVHYRDDAYASPLLEKIVTADVGETTRTCPENRYIAASSKLPALACVEVSEPHRDIYYEIRIGSFHTRIRRNPDTDGVDLTFCAMYLLDEKYDGCKRLTLLYTDDGRNDLYCAKLVTNDEEEKYVFNRDPVTQKRIETDKNGSFRIVDVHEDGTEIVRSETKKDINRRLLSQETYDSLGNLTDSVTCEYSSDGKTSTSRELVKKDNGTEVTFVKTAEFGDNGMPVRAEQYTQEGSEILGRKQWEYRYNENGYLASSVCTTEDGTSVETTYTYTYSSKKK